MQKGGNRMKNKKDSVSLPLFGIPRLIPYLEPYRRVVVRMVLLALVCSVIDVCYPLFSRYVLDHFVAEATLKGLPLFIVLYIAVLALQALINDRSVVDAGTVEMCIDRDLRNKAFNHLQTLSFSYFNQNSVGYIHARVMSDTGKIGEAVSWRMMDCIWNGSYILFAIFVMLITDVRLALWMIALLAAAGLLISVFQKKLVAVNRRIREMNSKITGDFNEGITGARSIKLLGIGDKMQQEFEEDTEAIRRESVHAVRYSAMLISTVTLMSSAALAVVLWQGGILTRRDHEDRYALGLCFLCDGHGRAASVYHTERIGLYQHPGQHRAPDESPRGTRGRRGYSGSDRALRRQF